MYDEIIYFLTKCIKTYKNNITSTHELLDILNKGDSYLPPYGMKNICKANIDEVDFITFIYFVSSLSGVIDEKSIPDYEELRAKVSKIASLATNPDTSVDSLLDSISVSYQENDGIHPVFKFVSNFMFPKGVDKKVFYELLKKNPAGLLNPILMIRDINDLKADHEIISSRENISSKHKKLITQLYDDISEVDRLENCLDHYRELARRFIRNIKQYNREYSNKIRRYEYIISELEKGTITSQIVFEKVYNSFDDDIAFVREDFLRMFLESKRQELEELKARKQELHSDDSTKYISLLHDYGINFNAFSDKEQRMILKFSIDNIRLKLKLYRLLELSDISTIIYLPDIIINTYSEDIANNTLNKDYLKSHLDLFKPKYFENYQRIKELFISKDFNPLIFLEHSYLFFIDYNIVSKNLDTLEEYDLLSLVKSTKSLCFLGDKDLDKKIDLLIESGYQYAIDDSLDILNYSYESLKKLLLLKELDEYISDIEELYKYLDRENSIVLNKEIEQYLYDYSSLIPDDIKVALESNTKTSERFNTRVFRIGDVLVSNRRFINNLNRLNDIELEENKKKFYSVIYGSSYTYEEVLTIAEFFQVEINNVHKKEL